MAHLLTTDELNDALKDLPNWHLEQNELCRSFVFSDFNEAFTFLTKTALLSEKLNHHAHYSGVYNQLALRLRTHDAGGITEKDIKMATTISGYLKA
ncbi:MAG: 4a-hydroxytetrahydrobiopterin dehydratase [Bacteroidetes bacterium]|nr:4a-hydroxytetrahydrobiopterin dehydratase [Bacteroidota bacterium]